MQTLSRAAHYLTYLLTTFVSQARQQTKKIHVTRLKSLVKIPDSLYLKNGIVAQIVSIRSAFSQDTRSLYLKNGIFAQIVSIWSACSQDTRFSLFKK